MLQTFMTGGMHAALAGAGGGLVTFAQIAAPVTISALWQGAAIALVLWLCLGLTPRVKIHIGAAQRFGLWAAAFAAMIGLGFLPWLMRGTPGAIRANAFPGAAASSPWFQIDDRWAFAIAALWLIASLLRAIILIVQSLRLRQLWKSASPIAVDATLRALLAAAAPTRRPIELCTTSKLDRPSVIGFLAPRILIPEWLFSRLTPGELEQVVLHEAEHLRRRDDWSNLFQKLALVLFPLNPALAWIEHRLCREREMACDEGVVRRTQAPRAYAECLTSLAERRLELRLERRRAHALSLGAFERRPELVRRVYSILARKQALHPIAARALVGVAGCSLLAASVELARCPQMVAFVPAPQTTNVRTEIARSASANSPRESDRTSVRPTIQPTIQPSIARSDSGFRVVDTKAVLPADHGIAPFTPASSRRPATTPVDPANNQPREFASTNAPAPREVLLRAEMPAADRGTQGQDADSHSAANPQNVVPQYVVPQYVLLTTWEEVQTSPRNSTLVADYDTTAAASPQSPEATNQNGGETITRITITRLILAVYPIGFSPDDSASSTKPAHAQVSGQPPAPLPVGGWLAFKL